MSFMKNMKKKSKTSSLESQPEINKTTMAEITKYKETAKKAILKAESRKEATPVVRLFVTAKVKNDPTKQRPAVTLINTLKKDKNSKPFLDLFQKVCKATTIRLFLKLSWSKIKNNPDYWFKVCNSLKTELEDFCKKIEALYSDSDFTDTMKKCLDIITQHGTKDAHKRRIEMKKAYDNVLKNIEKGLVNNDSDDISKLKGTKDKTLDKNTVIFTNIHFLQEAIKTLIRCTVYGGELTTEYKNIKIPMTDLIKDKKFENDEEIAKVLTDVGSKALDLVEKLKGYLSEKKINKLHDEILKIFNDAVNNLKK